VGGKPGKQQEESRILKSDSRKANEYKQREPIKCLRKLKLVVRTTPAETGIRPCFARGRELGQIDSVRKSFFAGTEGLHIDYFCRLEMIIAFLSGDDITFT
jgi:hypothetical protein